MFDRTSLAIDAALIAWVTLLFFVPPAAIGIAAYFTLAILPPVMLDEYARPSRDE